MMEKNQINNSFKISINCVKCVHYQVSWNYSFPHMCKLWGIKSKYYPSRLVFESTGKSCTYFQNKVDNKSIS